MKGNPHKPARLNIMRHLDSHRLGLYDSSILFVCEGAAGSKIFDVSRVGEEGATLDQRFSPGTHLSDGFETYNLIPGPVVQIVVGPQELQLYEYVSAVGGGPGSLTPAGRLGLE